MRDLKLISTKSLQNGYQLYADQQIVVFGFFLTINQANIYIMKR